MNLSSPQTAQQGQVLTWHFHSEKTYENPYMQVSAWMLFRHESGKEYQRPAFWDGGNSWKVRFAVPESSGTFQWESFADVDDPGLVGKQGLITCKGSTPDKGGLLSMSQGKRNVIDAHGQGKLLVVDTAWALPWRATEDMCRIYAADRKQKGFNAVLLMTVQPDMKAEGPQERGVDGGFDRGFTDLSQGSLQQLRPKYFKAFDHLIRILLDAGITPIYQPIFHGYGWKGLSVIGKIIDEHEYCRYCRYLVARYGAWPAIYLVGADGNGTEPGVRKAGQEIESWDCYQQPTGMHYNPGSAAAQWQADDWLDFQCCQTGHDSEHHPERVEKMCGNRPVKGVTNGEPTYECMNRSENAAGWWQGHEAWLNFTAGGTFGVFYGAGSLWNWVYHADEPGHEAWCVAPNAGWREALDFEGSRYPGIVAKIVSAYDFMDLMPQANWMMDKPCVGKKHQFALLYLEKGGNVHVMSKEVPPHYTLYCAKTAKVLEQGSRDQNQTYSLLQVPSSPDPVVVVFYP
ncbi:DUF4038 domain-containing protein [Kiritimatiellota bacterium B12222]|nr:DUF4038 domain-containing protein [Kiritimatiellota bacterium B12222]